MPTELKMPALSPTMEEGTLAKWLVKEGDDVKSGDILAEIETDKATMEFEAVDEGKIAKILVPEGSEGVKVGAPIAIMAGEGEDAGAAASAAPKADTPAPAPPTAPTAPKADVPPKAPPAPAPVETPAAAPSPQPSPARGEGDRVKASPLARRLAQAQNIDLSNIQGSGPGGRIVRAAERSRRRSSGGWRRPLGHARSDGRGDPARGSQALQYPQDHCSPTDRGLAAGPAHLFDGRHPARCAAEAARRAQRRPRK